MFIQGCGMKIFSVCIQKTEFRHTEKFSEQRQIAGKEVIV